MSKIVIELSILGLEDKVAFINKALSKGIESIHYDIMDAQFVPAKSLPKEELKFVLKNAKPHIKDLHLMVFDAFKWIKEFINEVDFITVHYESESIDELNYIFKNYYHFHKIGIAIKPKTKISEIIEFLPDVSHVLVMSVEPGKGGQSFMESSLEKIVELKKYFEKYNSKAFIQVDGGINDVTAQKVIEAGATNLVMGSFLQKNIDNKSIMKKIILKY